MDPLSVTASIVAVLQLSAKILEYLNNVKDAPKDRTQCAVEMLNLCGLLYKLRDHVEQGDPTQPWYFAIHDLAVKNGPLDQFKQALETLQTKLAAGNRLSNSGEALVWKFKKEEISSILGRIERLKSLVELALQMDHFKLSRAIKDEITPVRVHVDNTEQRGLLEWISPTNYPAQQSDIIKRRQEGTGQWFLDTLEVAKWRSDATAILFCPGIPGAGKTMVAAIAIDSLLQSIQDTSVGVAYIYCNYKHQKEQDVTSILAAILKQLVQGRPSLAGPLARLHKQHAHNGTRPSADAIFTTLQSVISDLSTVYIVIDALDECRNNDGTRRGLLARIRDLQSKADVRFLATSRFLPDIVEEFKDSRRLEVRASDEDVRRFVAGQVHRLPNCIQRKHELQMLVQDKIAESVDGMFLLARLHTDSLLDKRTPKEIKATLARLSKGSTALDYAYKDAIHRIESQLARDSDLAKNVLLWITYAQRPLTTTEICCALAVENGAEELDPENVPDMEDLVSVCAGLVVVDEESRVVRLVHYTTQEYLERIRETWNPKAQLHISSTCLTYLSFRSFKNGSCSTDAELKERLQRHPFLDYAASYWGQHALPVQNDLCGLAWPFLLHTGSVACAIQVMSESSYDYLGYSDEFPGDGHFSHLMARFGLAGLLKEILEYAEGKDLTTIDLEDSYGQTSLYIAAENGHSETVSLLLDKGANPNARGGEYGNALQAASSGGHKQVVKVLLDAGAEVNAWGGAYGNALYVASKEGHEAVVEVLLDACADPNAPGGDCRNALQVASAGGHETVVKMLLNAGAEVNVQDGDYGNALNAASAKGHGAVVKTLLNAGAEVNARRGGFCDTALQTASSTGHKAVVKLLLEAGAEVNAQGGYYGDALWAALSRGHKAVVKMLLEKSAGANAQGREYDNAFQVASFIGDETMVKMLLEKDAEVNAHGGYYGNVLNAASSGGHEAVVKLLLDAGAQVNAQDESFGNALQAASRGGHETVVKLLLDKGADVNAQGGEYGNVLQAASRGGHEAVVKLLLDKGADPNAHGGHFGNALQAASWGGHEAVVKMLLDKDADPNAQGGHFGNTLRAASRGGHEAVVKLLLKKGANPNAQGGRYGSALQAASEGGNEVVVKLLLDAGADPNAQGGRYGNALCAASEGGHEAVVKMLLEKDADVNAQGGHFGNALQAASLRGNGAVVKLLKARGAR